MILLNTATTVLTKLLEIVDSEESVFLLGCISLCVLIEQNTKLLKSIKRQNKQLKKLLKRTKDKTNKR